MSTDNESVIINTYILLMKGTLHYRTDNYTTMESYKTIKSLS